jgi:phospholipid-transporting ATPase
LCLFVLCVPKVSSFQKSSAGFQAVGAASPHPSDRGSGGGGPSSPTQRRQQESNNNSMAGIFWSESPQKPSPLPRNWPKSTAKDIEDCPQREIEIGSEQRYHFASNFVKTSKYEPYNFLPKFLLEEFNPMTKIANCYFLAVSMMQCIPAISNTRGLPTTLVPLTFVVVVDGIFQVIEDLARHRADREANSSVTQRYDRQSNSFVDIAWSELHVGDFVKVRSREPIPADMIILGVTETSDPPRGLCYVETKSLDGETNLKLRVAATNSLGVVTDDPSTVGNLSGSIHMEHPNKLIDSFAGVLDLGERQGREPLQPNNVLLRGCVLRNCDWVVGIVVNTGHETKIMMSAVETKGKTSGLEACSSIQIQRIVLLLLFICFVGTTGQTTWNNDNRAKDIWYLDWGDLNPGPNWFVQFFYFFLLHATFIPVSLYVSMSIVRFFQSYFMNNDLEMYYERIDAPALVRTMTLNEELGVITHIFSDKTGTLTRNVMEFRKCSVAGVSYGQGITEIGRSSWTLQGKEVPEEVEEAEKKAQQNRMPHVSFWDPKYDEDLNDADKAAKIRDFFRVIAICHDVIVEKSDGELKLSASNPDDEALVNAAEYFGYKFCDREGNVSIIKSRKQQRRGGGWKQANSSSSSGDVRNNNDSSDWDREEVTILDTIEFSSKRKRMSVIIKEHDGTIRLFCKGADTAMLPRLSKQQGKSMSGGSNVLDATIDHCKEFSSEGLRILMVGTATLEASKYEDWKK